MKFVPQQANYDCGVACVAMLCGKDYDEALEICGNAYDAGVGIYEDSLLRILTSNGFEVGDIGSVNGSFEFNSLENDALIHGYLLKREKLKGRQNCLKSIEIEYDH